MNNIALLDRDGVINRDLWDYVTKPAEFECLPGVPEAIGKLCAAGFRLAVITNQAGIAKGRYDAAMLEAIHAEMQRQLAPFGGKIERVFYCPHAPEANCACRKPATGLIEQAMKYFESDLQGVPFVGDKFSDLEIARRTGCQPILVRTGYGEITCREHADEIVGIPVYEDLAAYVDEFLG